MSDTMINRDAWMTKVQALIDKANDPAATPGERDAFMAKADELMAKHAIEQFELEQNRPADQREKPIVATVTAPVGRNWRTTGLLDDVFYRLARHCGVMIGRDHTYDAKVRNWKVVGFAADVDYLQMLYLSVQITIVSQMEPKVDPNLPEVENYANLREAGVAVERILPLLGYEYFLEGYEPKRNGWGDIVRWDRKTNRTVLGRFRRQYAKLCKERGVEPVKGLTGEAYQLCFIDAFRNQLAERLRELQTVRDAVGEGHELVLVDRKSETQNLLWDTWPEMRSHPKDCACERCHGLCTDPDCKWEKCRNWQKDKDKPIRYAKARELVFNEAGAKAGRRAANTVNLSKGSVEGGTKPALG